MPQTLGQIEPRIRPAAADRLPFPYGDSLVIPVVDHQQWHILGVAPAVHGEAVPQIGTLEPALNVSPHSVCNGR